MKVNTVWLVVLVFIIYVAFLFIIQNKKKQQYSIQQAKKDEFLKSLKKGDYVVTMSGIYGYIKDIKSNKISLEVSKGIIMTMDIEVIMATLEK